VTFRGGGRTVLFVSPNMIAVQSGYLPYGIALYPAA
jgi:hypothetical protein